MKRGDEKFVSDTSLFCCSEHFTAKDYKNYSTGRRHDLVKNAVLSVFECQWIMIKRVGGLKKLKYVKLGIIVSVAGPEVTYEETCKSLNTADNHPEKESEEKHT